MVQLSRGKDSKSSKKNKDSKDGTASPNAAATNQSPVLTPSSSTSTLNDIRNKPLPTNSASHVDHAALAAQAQLNNGGNAALPDRFNTGGPGQGANGGGTPARHGPLPPTVIISPSAPVRLDTMLTLIRTVLTPLCSMCRHPVLLRPCRTISPPPRRARSH